MGPSILTCAQSDGRACISPLTLPPGGAHSPGHLGMLLLKTRELIVEGNGRGGREGGLKTHSPQPAGLGSGTGQESPKEISWDSRNVAWPPAARGLWDGNKPVLGFRKATTVLGRLVPAHKSGAKEMPGGGATHPIVSRGPRPCLPGRSDNPPIYPANTSIHPFIHPCIH